MGQQHEQQETTMAGHSLRRMVLVATMAAFMAVVSVMGAPAAFAHEVKNQGCGNRDVFPVVSASFGDANGDGIVCVGKSGLAHAKDNHVH